MQASQEIISAEMPEDRCGDRERMAIPAQLRVSGHRALRTVVHDLSISGFSATAINRMFPGQTCWLKIDGLNSLQAEVVWWENNVVGCAFADLINPVVHENILVKHAMTPVFRAAC